MLTPPSDVASLLYSLAYLRAPPSSELLDKCIRALGETSEEMQRASGDDLANAAMALATFQYQPR